MDPVGPFLDKSGKDYKLVGVSFMGGMHAQCALCIVHWHCLELL